MVKRFLSGLLFGILILGAAEPQKIWVIRHGQRAKVTAPDFDPALTAEGRRQAELAGEYLKKLNFQGKIYASPYRRTLETASIIAGILEKPVYIAPFLQEFIRFPGRHKIRERSIGELKELFPLLAEGQTLPDNWPVSQAETLESVKIRYRDGVEKLSGEVLLVTHGALLKAAHMHATGRSGSGKWEKMNWNCSLSLYEFDRESVPAVRLFFDVSFLPPELITDNEKYMILGK